MRIALITDGVWPYVLGGMQKHSYYLCKYLAQKKIEVDLFHFNRSQYDISKLEVFTEEEKKFIHSYIVDFPQSARFPGHYLYNSFRHSRLIFQAIEAKLETYDFIYTKGLTGWDLINRKWKKEISCAAVGVKFHGYEMFQKPPDFKIRLQQVFLLRRPVRTISRKADVVFSYGGKITELIKSLGVSASQIIELPSGVEASTLANEIKPVSGKLKFLFLGRYERRKGIEEFNQAILAFSRLADQPQVEFHFIGPIPQEKHLQLESVIYHGEIRDKEVLRKLTSTADVLVCPSWSEGMPNVILEAMANGLAVIATDVGATNVLVSEKNGWLLQSPDPEQIEAAIVSAAKLPVQELLDKKQHSLDLMRERFTWERLIERFCQEVFK
jgi:glycosyltransferase involved in cell wall biosynthesis